MKQIYYVIQTLLRGRGSNIIKVISLGLGLTMSILLFSRVAYEQSFDTCFKDYDNLYQVWSIFSVKGEKFEPQEWNCGPVAGAILENFPKEVESAVSLSTSMVSAPLYNGSVRLDDRKIAADSLFFRTMGIDVLNGNPEKDLVQKDIIFLSERFARKVFGEENPIGKTLNYDHQFDLTVKGIYANLPENATINPEAVISMPTLWSRNWNNYSWSGGDSWVEFIRFRPGADKSVVNARIDAMIDKYRPAEDKKEYGYTAFVQPIRDTYRNYDDVQRMRVIMSILGLAILFIAALNYVLISISSLSYRAKSVGVHKCSGANTGTIFGMFLWETGVIMLSSLLLVALLLFNFREPLEDMLDVSLAGLFSWENIWAPLSVIVILFMIGGMLPGQLFARIPVTQVFRRYTEGKKGWKRPLLFVQFAGTSFIFGLLGLVLMQSHYITNKERGFDYHRVAYASGVSFDSDAESDANRSVMLSLPYVEDGACSGNLLTDGLSGEGVTTDNGLWMSMRWVEFGKDYAPFMKLEFAEGKNMDAPGQILVNETFLKMMHWEDKPIGRQVRNGDRIAGNIVGVLKDFATSNAAYVAVQPMYATYLDRFSGNIQLRLKEPFDDNLKRLNEDMEKLFPTRDIVFSSFQKVIDDQNSTVTDFRNAALLAAITILFVTLMGLIGYINDEIQRRSKEIAIRKVNGAEASSILRLFSKDIFWISLPAVFLGGLGAWYIGGVWIEQFVEGVDFGICGFLLIACIVLLLIIGCVVFKAWRIANENPVDSIKSE